MKPTIGISVAIVVAIALVAGVVPMRAQDYPTRSITVIVPFPAGGASDVVARIISNQMSKILGQPLSAAPAQLPPRPTATPCSRRPWARMWRRQC